MKNFTFNEKEHLYELDGKPLSGITTILSVVGGNKTGALIQWAANMAVDYIKSGWDEENVIALKREEWEKLLNEARQAHRRKKEEAGGLGTSCHLWIEQWIKIEIKRTQNEKII